MKVINVGCNLSYEISQTTNFLFQVAVSKSPYQIIQDESITITPQSEIKTCRTDPASNRMHRVLANPGELALAYRATVELEQVFAHETELMEVNHSDLPADVLPYLNPSRYCESDKLVIYAWQEFGYVPSGHYRVQAISNWVHNHISYSPGSTNASTTACDVLIQRTGVCRDYAHLAISFCRALGIPARYVAGYAVNLYPPDFHGFFEAYLSDSWYLFDATKLAPVSGFVRIGQGRDAADISFATIIGLAESTSVEVWANDVTGVDTLDSPNDGGSAISSA